MEQSYFTITACHRCRKRKARCDAGIPACANCDNSGSTCEYTDPYTKERRPRAHLIELERQAANLENSIRQLKQNRKAIEDHVGPQDGAVSSPHTGDAQPELIHFESGGDGHFLGSSSGLHIARSILQSTRKHISGLGSEISEKQTNQATNVSLPEVGGESPVALQGLSLPQWDTVEGLLEVFFRQFEVTYPILVQEEFISDVQSLYSSRSEAIEEDPKTQFMLDIVLSISYHLVSQDSLELATLAEKHLVRASSQLGHIVEERDYRTLQCLLLLLLSSILNPKSAPMWYISGICMRMCVDLGYHTEPTISHEVSASSTISAETKRRLFWVTYCFDRSLAIMLGRPFFINDERIEVDSKFNNDSSNNPSQALHWLKLKRMESKIAQHLHTIHSSASPISNHALISLDTDIDHWLEEARLIVSDDITNMEMWESAHTTAKLMLHRPLLIGSAWSNRSLLKSYEAAIKLIHLTFIKVQKGLLELTWLDLHSHLVSGLTLLFLVLRSTEIRNVARKEWIHFKSCVTEWQTISERLAARWNSVAKIKSVLSRLADETLDSIHESATKPRNQNTSAYKRRNTKGDASSSKRGEIQQTFPLASSSHELHSRTGGLEGSIIHHEIQNPPTAIHNSDPNRPQSSAMQDKDIHNYSPQTDHNSHGTETLFDNLDFPSVLGGDFWAELEQFDIPLQPHFVPFPNDQTFLEPLGPPNWQLSGRLDTMLTDSVLNFQGAFEEDDINM